MIQAPLLPKKCSSCGKTNYAHLDMCDKCGTELPESEMPKGGITEEDTEEAVEKSLAERVAEVLEQKPHLIEKYKDEL